MSRYLSALLVLLVSTVYAPVNADKRNVYERVIAALEVRNGGHQDRMRFEYTNAKAGEEFILTYSMDAGIPILTMRYVGTLTYAVFTRQPEGQPLNKTNVYPRILSVVDRGAHGTDLWVQEELPTMPEDLLQRSKSSHRALAEEYISTMHALADYLEETQPI